MTMAWRRVMNFTIIYDGANKRNFDGGDVL